MLALIGSHSDADTEPTHGPRSLGSVSRCFGDRSPRSIDAAHLIQCLGIDLFRL